MVVVENGKSNKVDKDRRGKGNEREERDEVNYERNKGKDQSGKEKMYKTQVIFLPLLIDF